MWLIRQPFVKAQTHQAEIGRLRLSDDEACPVAQSQFGVSRTLGRDTPYLAFHGRHKLSGQETTLISCSGKQTI